MLVEPARSTWVHNETGNGLGCTTAATTRCRRRAPVTTACRTTAVRPPGKPVIRTGDLDDDGKNDSYREFYFEYTDFQHAYEPGVYVGAGTGRRVQR